MASSWHNEIYPEVVEALRQAGHDVYDFRSQVGSGSNTTESNTTEMSSEGLLEFLDLPKVRSIFKNDMDALEACDAVVCVLPCGRSAHLELGYGIGAGKRTVLLWHDGDAPDIMHKAVDAIVFSVEEIPGALNGE